MVNAYRTVLWLLLTGLCYGLLFTGLCYGYCLQDCAMVTAYRTVLWLLFTGLCYGYCLQDCTMVTVYRTVLWLLFTGLCCGYSLHDCYTPSSFFLFILLFSDPSFLIFFLYLSFFWQYFVCVINLFFSFHFVPSGRVEIRAFPFLGRVITQWLERRRSRVGVPAGAARECSSAGSILCADSHFSICSTSFLPQ